MVYVPPLTDPESKENKYIRKNWVSPPDPKYSRAFLVEFGVRKLNTVGVVVGVQFTGDTFEFWIGEPGRTDRQQQRLPIGWDRNGPSSGGILWLSHPDFQITPQRSLYICLMSCGQEMDEPNDVMYFAV